MAGGDLPLVLEGGAAQRQRHRPAYSPIGPLLSFFVGRKAGFFRARSPTPGAAGLPFRYESEGDEGTSVRKTDVREMQGDPPRRRGARDLLEPPAQAATGLARWRESQA